MKSELFFELAWAVAFAILVALFLVMGLRLGASQSLWITGLTSSQPGLMVGIGGRCVRV